MGRFGRDAPQDSSLSSRSWGTRRVPCIFPSKHQSVSIGPIGVIRVQSSFPLHHAKWTRLEEQAAGRSLPFGSYGTLNGGGKSELRRAVCRITSGTQASRPEDGQCNRDDTARDRASVAGKGEKVR